MTNPSQNDPFFDVIDSILKGLLEGLIDIIDESQCERDTCCASLEDARPVRTYFGCARGSGTLTPSTSGCACRAAILGLLDVLGDTPPPPGESAGSRCCPDQTARRFESAPESLGAPATPRLVVECLHAFGRRGNPETMASMDLAGELAAVPGVAGKGWSYAEITPARLAKLLAPYDIHPRNIALPDGQRRKGYSRRALVGALDGRPV
ncbi:DUF3631 domain-containing protein [Streptomyces sp. NPDC048340]|uniref:DUF3631 domain-containing protein n=1 Tax=Streptomyces sp. NPDC048340 TaxID=3365537 RepID=UPI0037186345